MKNSPLLGLCPLKENVISEVHSFKSASKLLTYLSALKILSGPNVSASIPHSLGVSVIVNCVNATY